MKAATARTTRPVPEFGHDARFHRPGGPGGPGPARLRIPRRRRRGWKRAAAIVLRVGGVGCACGLAWFASVRAASSSLFDLRRVVVEGTRRARPDVLERRVRAAAVGNLFDLDLGSVRRRLEEDPWVRTAHVRRRLPDTIAVTVHEREPAGVALDGGRAMLVDEDGALLAECGTTTEPCDFPVLTGLDGLEAETRTRRIALGVAACREVVRLAPGLADGISEVDLAEPDRVRVLRDAGGAALLLSPEEPGRNLRNFLGIEADVRRRFEIVDTIDLRFRGRIAVTPRPGARGILSGGR